jgi:thiamine-phosphate pyrophosphorylase
MLSAAPLYAILDTAALLPGVTQDSAVDVLLQSGVRVIQYRHKGPFRRMHFEDCVSVARKVREAGGIFIVNDRADVAGLCGAAGVHLGQDDLPPEAARSFLGESHLIGYSTHCIEQVRRAALLPVDYIAIGPVFLTHTKENPDPVVGLGTVSAVRALTNKPLVAIGGITMGNAPSVLAAGADGVAVVRDLLVVPDLGQRASAFLAVLKKQEPEVGSRGAE